MSENYTPIFITVITFLGSLVFLISLVPPDFYVSTDLRGVSTADFDSSDLEFYNNTWSHYLDTNGSWWVAAEPDILNLPVDSGDFGGWNLRLEYSKANLSHHIIRCTHVHEEWWGIIPSHHRMTFSFKGSDRGTILSINETVVDMTGSNLAKYSVSCDHFRYRLFLTYNNTLYSSLEDAWNHYKVLASTGIEFNEMNTGLNAWTILSALVFFQLPNVHWTVNALLAIPIYAAVIIISFILILEVIKALPLT